MHHFYKALLFVFIVLVGFNAHAQLDYERIAWNRLQDGKYDRAFRLVQKSLIKDASNLEANYVLANWYFANANPDYQLDSAYKYVNKSISFFDSLAVREKERYQKFPIDSINLRDLRARIDSAAFVQTKQINTEGAYIRFIKSFPYAIQIANAVELRDEVSFLEALKVNTHAAYKDYLLRYPQSHRAQEASERYEKLLFDEKTRSARLADYKTFIKEYPESPYRSFAERQVFEIATASGEPDAFFAYLKENPESSYKKFIQDLMFHIYKEMEEPLPEMLLSDSLKNVIKLDSKFWIPVLKNGEFGFIDQTGAEMLAPQFEEIADAYKCGPVKQDILTLRDGYFSRSGKLIATDSVELRAIGSGFLEIESKGCVRLIHKSGRRIINDCFEEFVVIDNSFIAGLRNGIYSIFTLTGRLLPITNISDVVAMEDLIVFTRAGKKVINSKKQLAALTEGKSFYNELVFDEVKVVDKGLLQVRLSSMEGIISDKLEFVVPLDNHTLTKTFFGLIETKAGGTRVHGLSEELDDKTWGNVQVVNDWLILRGEGKEFLFHLPTRKLLESEMDTVWFERKLAFIQKGNQQKVYLSGTKSIELSADSKINFIPSRDSVQFFFTTNKKKHQVFTLDKGEQVLTTEYDIEESLNSEYFIVAKGAKKGVLARNGKLVVPVEMDIIVVNNPDNMSLLKNKKFGLFDMKTKRMIKPEYERNVVKLNHGHFVVYKDGAYGVINASAKPVTEFEFTEIQPWSDSVVWAKKNSQWVLLNFLRNKIQLDQVRSFTWIKNNSLERIAKIHRENYYGIINNREGMVIPASFTEIINLGIPEEPFYFTEKYIEEAGIYIVVYYNKHGKLLRRQAYEETEYERILCEDK